MYSTALLVTQCKAIIPKESPKWKIRLKNKFAYMRNKISCLEHLKIGTLRNTKVRERLIKKYHLEVKTIAEIVETIKQRVTSTTKKVERYEARCQQFRQNRLFNSNQRRFYQNLEEAIIIQQKYQIRKKPRSSGRISGNILNDTVPK